MKDDYVTRLAVLEALEADVREWVKPSGQGVDNGFWIRRVRARLAVLDALQRDPEPAEDSNAWMQGAPVRDVPLRTNGSVTGWDNHIPPFLPGEIPFDLC